jgi:hypothetical protein
MAKYDISSVEGPVRAGDEIDKKSGRASTLALIFYTHQITTHHEALHEDFGIVISNLSYNVTDKSISIIMSASQA